MTIVWHLGAIFVSHASENEVSRFIKWIQKAYGTLKHQKVDHMHIQHGDVLTYLGMKFDFTKREV